MKKIAIISILMASLALAGCATQQPPSPAQISSASYGELPNNYQDLVKSHFAATLKDPYSAQYSFLPTFKGYAQDGPWAPSGGGVTYGYVIPVLVNAKNSYGGYTGNQKHVFIFSGGVLYDTTLNATYGRVKPVN
ncbi:hypothetical protein [Brenneria goodwinii]|uniref:hypothetical protein n=1 Tax=Brenneria goodwinii TaxID=1109412 RepID=UPI000BAEF227|nr:hypothetical protein [Brenneria goodwinii]